MQLASPCADPAANGPEPLHLLCNITGWRCIQPFDQTNRGTLHDLKGECESGSASVCGCVQERFSTFYPCKEQMAPSRKKYEQNQVQPLFFLPVFPLKGFRTLLKG